MDDVVYVKNPAGVNGEDAQVLGLYRIRVGDFVCLMPHWGRPGTVSEDPLPVEDPEVRELFFQEARLRLNERPPDGGPS